MDDIHESLLIGFSRTPDKDSTVMIVGRQKNNKLYIVNAFSGDEALELYKKLTTKKEN